MRPGYCSIGPKWCACVGMFREGREVGYCPHWKTPSADAVTADVSFTAQDVDDLLVRHKLTGHMKRRLRAALAIIQEKT
jgi:hypothetical protein